MESSPADDLQVGEVGLPHLVRSGSLELFAGLDDIGRRCDQAMSLEQAVDEASDTK